MAPVSLNVGALWRPWRQAGLPHLLLEAETVCAINDALTARRTALVTPTRQASSRQLPVAPVMPATPASSVSSSSVPRRAPEGGVPVAASAPSTPARSGAVANAPHIAAPPVDVPPVAREVTPALAPLPLSQWPEAWKERLRKTPPTPRIVWTYAELSQDLAGLGEASRGVFFRALFGELGMEPGSQALWPLNMPPQTGVDALFFVSGVEALCPVTVVFMGDKEPDVLDFPRIAPFCSALWRGRRFVRLHSVDALRADTQSRHNQLISQIKSFHRT